MRSQSPFVAFHPELFQVKSKRQKEQLRSYVLPPPCEETAETKVVLEQTEGTLYLDRTALTQIDSVLCRDVLKRSSPQLLKRLVYPQLLGLVSILRFAAFFSNRTAGATFASVRCHRNISPVLKFCALPAQAQLTSLRAGITVFFGIIGHVLHAPNLFLEAAALLLLIVCRLYEA